MIRGTFSTLALLSCALAGALVSAPAPTPSSSETLKIFSGEPRLVVVHGYSTSFHWWAMLQRKIDRFRPGERVIEVNLAAKGGTPIAKWIDVASGDPKPAWIERLRPALQKKGSRPAIVLAQQSLQWAFGDRRAGISGPDDNAHIQQGADAIEKYVRLLLADGADQVFLAAHIYKKPMEPAIGNERFALSEALQRGIEDFHPGPDVWEPTSKLWPRAFARDKVHPNSIGAEVMAQLWFETLLAHDGLAVPAWSREEMRNAIDGDPLGLRDDRSLFGRLLKEWKIPAGARAPWQAGSAR